MLHLSHCTLCPRACRADRTLAPTGFCGCGSEIRVARAALHHWEEPIISGKNGSGTVFFTGCCLKCIYCQNYEISSGGNTGFEVTPQRLSEIFFELIAQGAHNINLVNPTQYALGIQEALLHKRLPVPVIYNSSGYESVATLKLLEGLVDVYLPDYKYADNVLAKELSGAGDYQEATEAAIGEMLQQTGGPVLTDGRITRGTIIRHLILPLHTKNSVAVLHRIHALFPEAYVSLMAQYTPCGKAEKFAGLNRPITRRELEKVTGVLFDLKLQGFVQALSASSAAYIPDFREFQG